MALAFGWGVWGGVGLWAQATAPAGATPAAQQAAKPAGGVAAPMEFADDPNFAVAGVTDWTAVGGHGSDAVLRTSEDLTRETVRLRGEDATKPSGEEEARLRAALAREPECVAAARALGSYLLRAGRFREAVPVLGRVAELSHGQAEDEFALARACQGVGDPKQAQTHLQLAMTHKDEARYHALAGELAEARGDALLSVRELQRAAAMEPSEPNEFAWGSELLLHRAIWQAAEVFARGATEYPASARMRTAWGAALFAGARYEEASQQLCQAAAQAPADAEPYLFLGKMALVASSPLPCVRETLGRFAALRPESAEAQYLYGMALIRGGDAKEVARGRELLEKAVVLDPRDAAAYLELGILASGRKDDAEAIRMFEKATAADTQLAEAHYRLGVAYDRRGEAARAQQEFAVHDKLTAAQAQAAEEQRREVKQFLVVENGGAGAVGARP